MSKDGSESGKTERSPATAVSGGTAVKPRSQLHLFPRAEDLTAVAASLATATGAEHALLSLDPARFAAGTVGTANLPPSVAAAVHELGAPLDIPEEGLQFRDFSDSPAHASVRQELEKAGISLIVRLPLKRTTGAIGIAELYFSAPFELTEVEQVRLQLQVEHAAINVVNVRLLSVIERGKKEWESTFDAIRDGISIHDRNCHIRRANWGLGMMLGTTPSLLVGKPCHEAIFGKEERCTSCPFRGGGEGIHCQATEHEDVIDGRPVHVSMYPLVMEGGELSGLVHIVRDISQRKREEEDFRNMHDGLVKAHATLQDSMSQLQEAQIQLVQSEKMVAVGQLIAGVAHELNNPLSGIIGYSQLLQDGKGVAAMKSEKLERFVQKMGKEAVRCQKIVENLLTFARRNEPEKTLTDLNVVVTRTVDLMAYDLRVSDVELEIELGRDLPLIMADPHQLQQVLLNVIQNAAQSIRQGTGRGSIRITTDLSPAPPSQVPAGLEDVDRWLSLVVSDDGPGFTDETRDKMFDPFYTTKEVGQGTGLGLSICYGIVKEHQGEISAQHADTGGAQIRVLLPVVKQGKRALPTAGPAAPRPIVVQRGLKVLVVDDEVTICDMVRDILAVDGYVVDVARDGRAGLEAAMSGDHDCILSDLRMPEVDGPTLHARLAEQRPELLDRLVFMTGDTLADASRNFLEDTGRGYISKPFSIQTLRSAVADVVGSADED